MTTAAPQMLSMSLDDYAANTTPFFAENPFFEVETKRRIDRVRQYRARVEPL